MPAAGGTVTFAIAGGTQTSYIVSTDTGTLASAGGSGASVTVNFGETFDLVLPANFSGVALTVTLTAIDQVTGVQQTTTVPQD